MAESDPICFLFLFSLWVYTNKSRPLYSDALLIRQYVFKVDSAGIRKQLKWSRRSARAHTLHFANSWAHKPLKYILRPLSVRDAFRISTWSLSRGLCYQVRNSAFAVLLLAVIKQRCIDAGAPFWIGGELPVFVVRPHAPNREVRIVTVRYEYMYRATPRGYVTTI